MIKEILIGGLLLVIVFSAFKTDDTHKLEQLAVAYSCGFRDSSARDDGGEFSVDPDCKAYRLKAVEMGFTSAQ